jgi:hypothetical protein
LAPDDERDPAVSQAFIRLGRDQHHDPSLTAPATVAVMLRSSAAPTTARSGSP